MLGKLFNLTTGSPGESDTSSQTPIGKPVASLESVQEDIHTRNLLFPDAEDLYQHRHDQVFPLAAGSGPSLNSSASPFDYSNDLELEMRDIRVVIMQDGLSAHSACMIFDSQPPPDAWVSVERRSSAVATGAARPPLADPRRIPTSPRDPSLPRTSHPMVIQSDGTRTRHDRRASMHNKGPSHVDVEPLRPSREYLDEIGTFSSCIFGNSELMAYKGTSTKVHLVPAEPREFPSFPGDGRGSIGRASVRSSKLSQSFSSEQVSPFHQPTQSSSGVRAADRKKVLITRLFPVTLPNDDDSTSTPHSRYSEDSSGYPFPHYDDPKAKKKKPQPKQKRTPMYAVALIINLPPSTSQSGSASVPRDRFRGPSSYSEHDSFSSSFNSTRRSGWTMVGAVESADSTCVPDLEDRIDAITQHWDVIMRTLTHLQSVVATKLFTLLKQKDIASPGVQPASYSSQISTRIARTPSLSGRRSEDSVPHKPPKTNAKIVALEPFLLREDRHIRFEVDSARTRIVSGLRATRVVTGQNRWGIWREEARWVAKWAVRSEQNSFFLNLLTGFLATHVDWLQALSPAWYRKRFVLQQKTRTDEDTSLPARTIIISQDKMAARRIIFLLSAFLPANQQPPSLRAYRPSTSASFAAFPHSPPSYIVPILKEESLRRRINRRAGPRGASHSRNQSLQGASPRISGVPPYLAHLSMERGGHERRASDAMSVRSSHFPVSGSDQAARKSSAATTTTITPETTIPHFSTHHRAESFSQLRPGSSNSTVTEELKRTLTRGESSGHYSMDGTNSRPGSRWGSMISGLWGGARRSSNTSMSTGSKDSAPVSPVKLSSQTAGLPGRILKDGRSLQSPLLPQSGILGYPATPTAKDPRTPNEADDSQDLSEQSTVAERPERIPDPTGAFESPVKTSINAEDGVIDVDVPFPDYIASFETAVSSPSSSGYLSTPGMGNSLDAFEQSCRLAIDGDVPLNVAGWLQHHHPDFMLQAIPPQDGVDLMESIRASMRAEPSPTLYLPGSQPFHERWVDVSSVIVADATSLTVTRIRYRRLVRPKPAMDRTGTPVYSGSLNPYSATLLMTPSITPYEMQLEDEFIEEPLVTLDETLARAVERVITEGEIGNPGSGSSTDSTSKESSACSSRSPSNRPGTRRGRRDSQPARADDQTTSAASRRLEVPRAECKTVILSSLEEIVREVIDKRDEKARETRSANAGEDNGLQEAIKAWLESVELNE